MDNFFTEFWSPDSVMFMISVLFSFLIGLLTGWAMYGRRANRMEKEAEKWKKGHDDLLAKYNDLKEESDLKEADLVKAQRESREAIEIAKSLEEEKDRWQADLDSALEDSVKAQAVIGSYQATIEDLNNQIVGLKAMNADLASSGGSSASDSSKGASAAALSRLNELEEKLNTLQSAKSNKASDKRLKALEAKLSDLMAENNSLRTQLDYDNSAIEINKGVAITAKEDAEVFAPAPEMAEVDKGESISLSAITARDEVAAAIGDTLPTATEADKDDLTRIKGIGAFLEKKLNGLGIYTYQQISQLDAPLIEKVTAAIEFFPGRIKRDDWVGQAARLMDIKEESPEALEASAVFVKNLKDLKTVEGIGPKIEKLLKKNGIPDLKTLSESAESSLREILADAGSRYRMHDPTTWPVQAELAVKGEWDTLKDLQDKLKGGRDVG